MRTLYIDRKESELEIQGGRLLLRVNGVPKPYSIPLVVIEFIVISAVVRFSSSLLSDLTLAGITLVFINPRKEKATCIAHGLLHNAADRRLLQYQTLSDDSLVMQYSAQLVQQKIRGQRAVLHRLLRRRPDQRYALLKGINRLVGFDSKIKLTTTIDSLRGCEGAAAAHYFEAYQSVFAPRFLFTGRNRRPPLDPVNVVLSLTYTLMHAEATRALISVGFDPQLGIYHLPSFGRASLACDLVELYRPLIDLWVWRIFAREIVRLDHFSLMPGADKPCLLGKAGRSLFYQSYEIQARGWRKMLRRTCRHWLAMLQDTSIMQPRWVALPHSDSLNQGGDVNDYE